MSRINTVLLNFVTRNAALFTAPIESTSMKLVQDSVTNQAFQDAIKACLTHVLSHAACVSIVMYMDLSGRWTKYSMNKNRAVTAYDYWAGWRSFCVNQMFMFLPFMTFCFWYNADVIHNCNDTWYLSLLKLAAGYVLGKLWAFAVHYALHFPSLYRFHRRHHRNPKSIVASAAWEDSFVEYAMMEVIWDASHTKGSYSEEQLMNVTAWKHCFDDECRCKTGCEILSMVVVFLLS